MILYNHTIKFTWFVVLIFISCMDGERKAQVDTTTIKSSENNIAALEKQENQTDTIRQLKYFYNIEKSNGWATERIPFPATWVQHDSGDFAFTGPNGIRVYGGFGRGFSYSNDPTMMQLYQATGTEVKYPLNMEQTIEEFLMPIANKLNRKLVKKYPIPQLLEGHKNFYGMMYKVEPTQTQFDATALEWVDPDGTQWVTIFFYHLDQARNSIMWGFIGGAMGAPAAYFEKAKQDYLNGLLNKQINPQWMNAMNQKTEFAIRQSNEAHAQREAEFKRGMAQRQQQWEANQQSISNKQKQWEANQEAISRRNEMVSDAILGKVNIVDPESGSRHKIDNTSNRYWVNSQNKYIGTNTTYDDPNKNSFVNGETWREFKIDDYRN